MSLPPKATPDKKGPKLSAWVPSRPDPRHAAPERLGEVLLGAQSFIAKRSGAAIPRLEWTAIVGSRIAARTRVGKIYKGVLTIKVASSAWNNELSFLKTDLIAKLKRAGHDVTDLRLMVDKTEADEQPKPRGRAPMARSASALPPLPPELLLRLREVDDPNLRAAIAEAARFSLAYKKR